MKRNTYIAIALLVSCFSIQGQEKIKWKHGHKLHWESFRGVPDTTTVYAAITSSGIWFSYQLEVKNDVPHLVTEVESYFYPDESWYVPDRVNDYILQHERTHFDITEIYARRLRKALSELSLKGDIQRKISKIYSQIQTEHNRTQEKFDKETNHSIEADKEAEWELWVKHRLEELKAWH